MTPAAQRCAARVMLIVATVFFTGACLGTPTPLAPSLEGSVGVPHHGVLTNGRELPKQGTGYVRYRPRGAHYFGTPHLIDTLEQAAAAVWHARPGGAPLVVGDLAGRHGGKISRHRSHRTGRDADLLFYVTTPAGAPVPSPGFIKFGPDGLAPIPGHDDDYVRFDIERNWLLVKELVASEGVGVQWLFVSRPLEALLIDYALARDEDLALVWAAENVLHQPGDSAPHDDHFHLRVSCTAAEAVTGCEGGGPYWPWLPELPTLGPLTPAEQAAIAADDPFPAVAVPPGATS